MKEQISDVVRLLQEARRPIFVWGSGLRPYADAALVLARSLGIPVACTWGAIDLINHDDPLMCGGFGTHGTRAANFAVQNSDLVISIGSRLDTKATGFPGHFARAAHICMVDIDRAEIEKFTKLGRHIDIGICADAGEFIEAMRLQVPKLFTGKLGPRYNLTSYPSQIKKWRQRYDNPTVTWPGINPYELVKEIGRYTTKEDIICSDTGTALGYLMQAFPFKGERFLHAFNMTPMGYGLGAAVGAAFATDNTRRVILLTGDGSILMSLPELATISRWNLNIKIILLNNGQHSMCVQTENQWFGGRNASTTVESGLGFPDWHEIPQAFFCDRFSSLESLFMNDGRGFLEVKIHPDARLVPQARFGHSIEDQEPLLPREELREQMIVPILEVT